MITNSSTGDRLRGDVHVSPRTRHNFTCLVTDIKAPVNISWEVQGEADYGGTHRVPSQGIGGRPSFRSNISVLHLERIQDNLTCSAAGAGSIHASETIRLIQSGRSSNV